MWHTRRGLPAALSAPFSQQPQFHASEALTNRIEKYYFAVEAVTIRLLTNDHAQYVQ